ncbi:MAG: DUF4097 family beta strand repeat-containing protein [Lachnospiraceae bacterium]|nr:DUF4097 family beta strand repeat-containing protein [Lachnospiraceae bacterium]
MGKFAKVCLIAAAILIGLGLFVGTLVTAIGGRGLVRNAANEGMINIGPRGFTVWDWSWGWNEGRSWGRPWGRNWERSNSSDNWSRNLDLTVNGATISSKSYSAVFSNNNINSLDISVGVGDFKVIPWDKDEFQIEITGAGSCKYYNRGSTLYLEGFDFNGRSITSFDTNNNKFTIYVPENIYFNEIKIAVGVGALDISRLSVDNLKTDSGVGSLTMNDMIVNRLNISNSVGETIFKGEVKNDIRIENSIGSTSLRIKGAYEDFDYFINCALGNISIDRYSYTSLAQESQIMNNAGREMRLSCSIGNIDVSFY